MVESMMGPLASPVSDHDKTSHNDIRFSPQLKPREQLFSGKTTSDISLVPGSFTVTQQVKDAHHTTPLIAGPSLTSPLHGSPDQTVINNTGTHGLTCKPATRSPPFTATRIY